MASSPGFAATPNNGSALPGTADTSLTAPTNVVTVLTAAASGTRIDEIRLQGVDTTVAGVVNLFAHDSTGGGAGTYHLIDQVLVSAVTSSASAIAWQQVRSYQNLVLKSSSWSLRASQTQASNASKIKVSAFGADF